MSAAPANPPAVDLTTLLPTLGPSRGHGVGRYNTSCGGNSGETSATSPITDDRDAAWDHTAAFSDDIGSKASLSTARHTTEQPSALFQYFCQLCEYHGAANVPAFWASLLAGPSPAAQSSAMGTDTQTKTEGEFVLKEAMTFFSTVSTLDFTSCYVGPKMLLALADLCRVHRVAFARRQHHNQMSPSGARRGFGCGSVTVNTLPAVTVTAVAPLWSKARAPSSTDSDVRAVVEEACSLLPHLRTVRLVHLSLNFSVDGNIDTPSPQRDGNKVLLYVLEALQGHPHLQLLDLSDNPIASALVPALSRLVQSTGSLTTLVLENTLLLEDEKQMLTAQCLLNQLRIERDNGASSAPPLVSPLQIGWSAQTYRDVHRALEVGVSAVPWLLGKSTQYVRRYSASNVSNVPNSAEGSSGAAVARLTGFRKSTSDATLDAIGTASHSVLLPSFRSSAADLTYLCYDGTEATGTTVTVAREADGSLPSSSSRAGLVWTPECTEVVRSVFLDRQVAQQRVLGGRAAWPNVPVRADTESCVEPRSAAAEDKVEGSGHRPTVDELSASLFLRNIRQQLLPPPQAPPGLRHDADAAFLTTAEENYWAVRQTQDKQWGYLVSRLAEMLEPVKLSAGEMLYAEGEPCSSYVYFLPPELETSYQTYVTLRAGNEMSRVLPGQWVGEAEALGCQALYPNSPFFMCTSAAASSSALTAGNYSATTNVANTAKSIGALSPFARHSTARVATSASDGITVWALPFPVAFFYLYVPYQLLQQQFIQRTPISSFAHIHPVHLASVPVQLEFFHWMRNATTTTQRTVAASTVLCTGAYLMRHIVLLQEGEYLLRAPSSSKPPKLSKKAVALRVDADEQHLLSGNAVVTQTVLELDADARAANSTDGRDDVLLGSSPGGGRSGALGKEAALRQYRVRRAAAAALVATKAAAKGATGQPQRRDTNEAAVVADNNSAARKESRDAAANDVAALEEENNEEAVELRTYPSTATVAHWRYAGLSNEIFAALCPPLRLALTQHCCVIPETKSTTKVNLTPGNE